MRATCRHFPRDEAEDYLPCSASVCRGLSLSTSRISYTMSVFCHLYLPMILLMRSGDIETNPGPNNLDGSVSEWELFKLSELIGPSDYYKVGLSLKIPYAQLEGIMMQQLNNNTNALLAVFMKWNNLQQDTNTNKREVLADKLQKSGLVGLSDQLHSGKLRENFTEEPSRSLQSQIEPLSPTLIKQCREDFMFKYRSSLCKIRSDPLNPDSLVEFMYMYTNLVLKREVKRGQRLEKKLLSFSELGKLIANGKFPRRLLVQGEAGAGKTTLCAKIAWDWINGQTFTKFVWVLIVPLHESKQCTIGEIAKSYLTKSNPTTASQLIHYIRSNPKKVFIACDGLDEFSGKVEQCKEKVPTECQQPQSRPSTSTSLARVDNSEASDNPEQSDEIDIGGILCSEQLERCPVLLTSRPWKAKEIRSDGDLSRLYTFIHVEGFSEDDLSDYIHKFFPENDVADRLIKLMKNSVVISQNIAHYPLYVAILCLMWKEISERELEELESFQTFSQVFRQMFRFLKEHYAQKKIKNVVGQSFRDCLEETNNLLEPVTSVALTGLLKDKLVFDEGDFKGCFESMETACRVGILSQENQISSMLDSREGNLPHMDTRVFFPHKLFQEYMAGMSLASMCRSDSSEFERVMNEVVLPRSENFRYLLYFAASQGKEVGRKVIECMAQGLKERTHLLVDVAFESNHPDAVAVMHDWFPPEVRRIDIDDDMTSHTLAAYQTIRKDAVDINIDRDCNSTDSHNAAMIVCSSPSLKHLDISGSFHDNFFKILKDQGTNIQAKRVSLSSINSLENGSCTALSRSMSNVLAKILCSLENLCDLTLLDVNVYDEFYSTVKEKAPLLKIETLTISSTDGSDYWEMAGSVIPSLSSRADDDLAEALSSLPKLANLTLELILQDTLFKKMHERATSFKNCFPQVTRGNFIFNGVHHRDIKSFLHTLEQYESEERNWHQSSEDDRKSDGSQDEQDVQGDDGEDDGDDLEDDNPEGASEDSDLGDDPQVDNLLIDQQHLPSVSVAEEAQATSTELQGMYLYDHHSEEKGRPCPHHSDAVHDGTLKRKVPSTQSAATTEVPEKRPRNEACCSHT